MDSPPAAPLLPRDSSSPEPSFSAQIATLQAQLAALQASQPLAAAAPTPPAVAATPVHTTTMRRSPLLSGEVD
ncbi:hypothetical protein MVLG_06752, partial [Microbotryum lychnidis-dioicae p1A1 Lamole]